MKSWWRAAWIGALVGLPVLGIGGRVAMRIIAATTEAPDAISIHGTINVLLAGTASGALGGVIYRVLLALLPRHNALRIVGFAGALAFLTARGLHPVALLPLALFGPLVALYGVVFLIVWRRSVRHVICPSSGIPPSDASNMRHLTNLAVIVLSLAAAHEARAQGTLSSAVKQQTVCRGDVGQNNASTLDIVYPRAYPVISSVAPGSPADIAGVKVGDTILEQNGADLVRDTPNRKLSPGDTLALKVRRGSSEHQLTLVLGRMETAPGGVTKRCVPFTRP